MLRKLSTFADPLDSQNIRPDLTVEFRIAPYIMLVLGIIIQLSTMPEWNDSAMLIEQGRKYLIIEGIILVFSVSAYFRHHFYSRKENTTFIILLTVFLTLGVKYLYQYLNF